MLSFTLIAALLAATTLQATPLDDGHLPLIDQNIDTVNSMNTSWTAGINQVLQNLTKGQGRRMCGAFLNEGDSPRKYIDVPDVVPSQLDLRQHYPKAIHPIGFQGYCGSCYAFAVAGVTADRYAMKYDTLGMTQPAQSQQYIVSCNNRTRGCDGGWPKEAFNFIFNGNGIMSEACYPYTNANSDRTASCRVTPANTCPGTGESIRYYTLSSESYDIGSPTNIASTQHEIMNHGPVSAVYSLYDDFYTYSTGVYQHVTGGFSGLHAVKIIGWGIENGVDYWLAANSWSTSWANYGGYFKIRRGTNECGIEDQMEAAQTA